LSNASLLSSRSTIEYSKTSIEGVGFLQNEVPFILAFESKKMLARVVQKVDKAIHRINRSPADSVFFLLKTKDAETNTSNV